MLENIEKRLVKISETHWHRNVARIFGLKAFAIKCIRVFCAQMSFFLKMAQVPNANSSVRSSTFFPLNLHIVLFICALFMYEIYNLIVFCYAIVAFKFTKDSEPLILNNYSCS